MTVMGIELLSAPSSEALFYDLVKVRRVQAPKILSEPR